MADCAGMVLDSAALPCTSGWEREVISAIIIGVIFLGVIFNGLTLRGVGEYWQLVFRGALILAAVLLNTLQQRTMR